jgi:GNAT superfamily N-acetyltransferase
MRIDKATPHDMHDILALFDQVQAWLSDRGLSEQWGTIPFSANPAIIMRFQEWIDGSLLYLARSDEAVMGTLVFSPRPPAYVLAHCTPYLRQSLYLEAFATCRDHAGQGVGHLLLQAAEAVAREQGLGWLQLDCWAGNPGLRRYYRHAGFTECCTFTLGTWQGVLCEKPVSGDAGYPEPADRAVIHG